MQAGLENGTISRAVAELTAREGGIVDHYRHIRPREDTVSLVVYHQRVEDDTYLSYPIPTGAPETITVLTVPHTAEGLREIERAEKLARALIEEFRPETDDHARKRLTWEGCSPKRQMLTGKLVKYVPSDS